MTTALVTTALLLATPSYVWLRWLSMGHEYRAELPEHAGADESWSPLAALAVGAADWDEDAQLHVLLDEMQARWKVQLDTIEVMALAFLAIPSDGMPTRELAGVAG